MQFKQNPHPLKASLKFLSLVVFLSPIIALSQTTYLPQGDKANILLERLEIKARKDSILNFSKTKPFSRKQVINGLNSYIQRFGESSLSKTDAYNLHSAYLNNLEYLPADEQASYKSKKPIGIFYKTPANL